MFVRRLAILAVALAHGVSAVSSAASDSTGTVKPQCSGSITDADAPVIAPLVKVFGENLVQKVFGFMTGTPFGKVLVGKEAYSCIANMNGTVLGNTVMTGIKSDTCKAFTTITDIPFINTGVMMLANKSMEVSISDTLKFLKSIPSSEMDSFCTQYTEGIVPCISSVLLPSLAVVRAKYSNGCCDGWVDSVLSDYGYSISGQITKMAQLFGDVMCSTQTPSFTGQGSQRCGYTWLQTILTKPDEASTAAAVLKNLQVPTDQMCLRAEGKAYTDVNKKAVDATTTEPTPSGCVTPMDRLATWVAGLPATKKSEAFDIKALFEDDGTCLKGSELFPTITYLIPELNLDELKAYFSKSCVHLPTKFAAKCAFSRPATSIKWASEPSPAKETVAPTTTQPNDTAATSQSPSPTTTSGAPCKFQTVLASMIVAVVASTLL